MLCALAIGYAHASQPVMILLMLFVIPARCSIEAQSYGANSNRVTKYGFLKLNGVAVWQASWHGEYPVDRGVNTFTIDTAACTVQDTRRYDTYGDSGAAARLRDYLQGLSDGTVLVAISSDAASRYLDAAESTLTGLGADVTDVEFRGAWAFITKVGDPSSTVLDKELTQISALARDPVVHADFAGSSSGELTSDVSYIDAVGNVVSNDTNFSIFRVVSTAFCLLCY